MEGLIMRMILILAVTVLVTISCSKEENKVTTTASESEAAGADEMVVNRNGSNETEIETSITTGENDIHPVLNEYQYPNSALDGKFEAGNTVSFMFLSPDEFIRVVEFYQKKFPESPPPPGGNAYYAKTDSYGSVTITVTSTNNTTQIILRLDKK
jgi:hypothetical protein